MKIIAQNKRAYFDYKILETYEAGIVLTGEEIKSIRAGNCSINTAYVKIFSSKKNQPECYLLGAMIKNSQDDQRTRKLLLKKAEINKLLGKTTEKGLTIVPIKLFIKHNFAKLDIGLAQGLKKFDKRNILKKKEIEKNIRKMHP